MAKKTDKNPAAVALGRLGGMVKSEAKKAASKRNIMVRWNKNKQHLSQ
jgi:hypothetical protein